MAKEWRAYAADLEQRMRSMRERSERATMQPGFLDPALYESLKVWGYADERRGPPPKDQRP
jgi:hypothetical protein